MNPPPITAFTALTDIAEDEQVRARNYMVLPRMIPLPVVRSNVQFMLCTVSPSLCFFPSLSLSSLFALSHSHTHIHTHARARARTHTTSVQNFAEKGTKFNPDPPEELSDRFLPIVQQCGLVFQDKDIPQQGTDCIVMCIDMYMHVHSFYGAMYRYMYMGDESRCTIKDI